MLDAFTENPLVEEVTGAGRIEIKGVRDFGQGGSIETLKGIASAVDLEVEQEGDLIIVRAPNPIDETLAGPVATILSNLYGLNPGMEHLTF